MNTNSQLSIPWLEIALFYTMCLASRFVLILLQYLGYFSTENPILPSYVTSIMIMWGPGISALVCRLIFNREHKRHITLFGTSPKWSCHFFFFPLVVLSLLYMKDIGLLRGGSFLIRTATWGYFMILGEELGWRGYLQDRLYHLHPWKKYLCIGVLWEFWHLRFLWPSQTAGTLLLWLIVTLVLSFIIGKATDHTQSLTVAVTVHLWVDLIWEVQQGLHVSPERMYFLMPFLSLFWIALLYRWPKSQAPYTVAA